MSFVHRANFTAVLVKISFDGGPVPALLTCRLSLRSLIAHARQGDGLPL